MRTKTTRQRRAGLATEARILEAAEEVFARYGYEGARMEQVAERAGVEKANIYYYFKGKEQLYRALMESVLNRFLTEAAAFLQQPYEGDSFTQLDEFLDLFFTLVERYQSVIALAFGELIHPPRKKNGRSPAFALLQQIETMAAGLIKNGIQKGQFRDQDAVQAIITLEGLVFYYFFLPEERVSALIGGKKFDPSNLQRRREALSRHMRGVLQK